MKNFDALSLAMCIVMVATIPYAIYLAVCLFK